MAVSLVSTGITFPDGTTQTTAAGAGGVTSLNGQTGAITNTTLYAIGSYVSGRPLNVTSYGVNSTVAGSILYSTSVNSYAIYSDGFAFTIAGASLTNTGSWRCVSAAPSTGGYASNDRYYTGLWVRYA